MFYDIILYLFIYFVIVELSHILHTDSIEETYNAPHIHIVHDIVYKLFTLSYTSCSRPIYKLFTVTTVAGIMCSQARRRVYKTICYVKSHEFQLSIWNKPTKQKCYNTIVFLTHGSICV